MQQEHPQLVLDYASPRKRGKVRLPATSKLDVTHDRDGGVRVVETLSGHGSALSAIAFASFVVLVIVAGVVSETRWILDHKPDPVDFITPGLMALFALIEVALIVLVIRNTWRRTTLVADAHRVTLAFTAPLMRAWRREWTAAEAGTFALVPTQSVADAVRLAELQLRPAGMAINLFTDHRAMDLESLAQKLNRALSGMPPAVEPLRSQQVILPEVPPPDPQTFRRLRASRDGLKDRLH